MCEYECRDPWWPEESNRYPGAGGIGSCELPNPDMSAGTQTQVLFKNIMYSQLLSHFSSPYFPIFEEFI